MDNPLFDAYGLVLRVHEGYYLPHENTNLPHEKPNHNFGIIVVNFECGDGGYAEEGCGAKRRAGNITSWLQRPWQAHLGTHYIRRCYLG